jgi:hypothetical protein
MKSQNFTSLIQAGRIFILILILFSSIRAFPAAIIIEDCKITKTHGQGYATTIASVNANGDGSHTISLLVSNDGCPGSRMQIIVALFGSSVAWNIF